MIDVSKIQKMEKNLEKAKISMGISEPDVWLSTGNYALNFNLTGDFSRGIPNRRSTMLWGLSGTGKSFLAASIAKEAQDKGYYVVYIDTEDSVHTEYFEKIGLDMSREKFMTVRISTIGEAIKTMSEFFDTFDEDDKVCYILDSLTMLETEKESEDFDKGIIKGDMGQFAKQAKKFMKNVNNKIGDRDNFFIMTNHAYDNQDVTNGEGVSIPSGGKGIIFVPSISIFLKKLKLKEGTDIIGVRITAETTKSRFTQLGRKIQLEVPYDRGIDPLDGLIDLAEQAGLVSKAGAWYSYELDGEVKKFQKKNFADHYLNLFDFDTPTEIEESEDYQSEEEIPE